MSNAKITRSNLIMTKPKDALHKAWLLPQKMYFKKIMNITPSKKYSNITPFKKYLNISSSKNVFQNCYKLSIENKNTTYLNYSIFKK